MKFDAVLCDPPWHYNNRQPAKTRFGRGVHGHYSVMRTKDICALPVEGVCSESCVLFLWSTWPRLPAAMQVIEAWGFTYKTIGFLWTKINPGRAQEPRRHLITSLYSKGLIGFLDWLRFFGVGHYAKSNTEPCLLATRGPYMAPATNKVSSVVFAPRGAHSTKPREIHRRIEQMYPLDKYNHIELFAREAQPGWAALGLEIDGADIGVALRGLVT